MRLIAQDPRAMHLCRIATLPASVGGPTCSMLSRDFHLYTVKWYPQECPRCNQEVVMRSVNCHSKRPEPRPRHLNEAVPFAATVPSLDDIHLPRRIYFFQSLSTLSPPSHVVSGGRQCQAVVLPQSFSVAHKTGCIRVCPSI